MLVHLLRKFVYWHRKLKKITQEDNIIRTTKAIMRQSKLFSGIKISLMVILILGFARTGFMQDAEKKERAIKTAKGGVSGEISGISKNYISVVYEKDTENGIEYEMLLPIDKDIQLEYKKSLGEMKIGDRVSIQYEDTTTEDSEKQKTFKREAKVVTFVGPAAPTPPEPQ